MSKKKQNLEVTNYNKEIEDSMLEYMNSVIVDRAFPSIVDGLKPVQRRILYTMHESGAKSNKPHRKSAQSVGLVLGNYHPHG